MQINLKIAKSKALSLKSHGFGKTNSMREYYKMLCNRIELNELTQIVAISYFVASTNKINFYSALSAELRELGLFKNRKNKTIDFEIVDWSDNQQLKQLQNVYSAVGFNLFYEIFNMSMPKSTARKILWKCFAKRKNEKRISKKNRTILKKAIADGFYLKFSDTSSSVYLRTNEYTIRMSDHESSQKTSYLDIIN